jgi:hypothetical protein
MPARTGPPCRANEPPLREITIGVERRQAAAGG